MPIPDSDLSGRRTAWARLSEELPSPLAPPAGRVFHTRCPHVRWSLPGQAPAWDLQARAAGSAKWPCRPLARGWGPTAESRSALSATVLGRKSGLGCCAAPGRNRFILPATMQTEPHPASQRKPPQRPLRNPRQARPQAPMRLERQGYEIISLNIGNPAAFGFRAPENDAPGDDREPAERRRLLPTRRASSRRAEAVVMQQQAAWRHGRHRGRRVHRQRRGRAHRPRASRAAQQRATRCSCRARTIRCGPAAATLNGGKVVHYPCRPENNFIPDPEDIAALVTKKTRAIVVINPNNPTGAVYPRPVLDSIARLAERARPRGVRRRDL